MKPITVGDLQPWEDSDDLLEALYELGEQTRDQRVGTDLTSSVTALLEHEDEDVRQEALRLLLVQWKDRGLHDQALEMLRLDPSEAVRGTAAFGVAAVSAPETRREDVGALLELLLDESQPLHVRGAAYEALLIIYRRREFPPVTRDLEPSIDIDWEWIRKLRTELSAPDT